MQRCESGGDLVGVVPEVVDDGDVFCGSDDLETPADADEVHQRQGGVAQRQAAGAGGGDGGEAVGEVVAAGRLQADALSLAGGFLGDDAGLAVGRGDDIGDGEIGAGVGRANR